jgi:hypothetical protein
VSAPAAYRTVDDAIRDGWRVMFSPGPGWWGDTQRYHVLAKRGESHIELAGNSLAQLRGALRMLKGVPLPAGTMPFTRDWWLRHRRGEV